MCCSVVQAPSAVFDLMRQDVHACLPECGHCALCNNFVDVSDPDFYGLFCAKWKVHHSELSEYNCVDVSNKFKLCLTDAKEILDPLRKVAATLESQIGAGQLCNKKFCSAFAAALTAEARCEDAELQNW